MLEDFVVPLSSVTENGGTEWEQHGGTRFLETLLMSMRSISRHCDHQGWWIEMARKLSKVQSCLLWVVRNRISKPRRRRNSVIKCVLIFLCGFDWMTIALHVICIWHVRCWRRTRSSRRGWRNKKDQCWSSELRSPLYEQWWKRRKGNCRWWLRYSMRRSGSWKGSTQWWSPHGIAQTQCGGNNE